jgi:CRISPR-associated endonuclease/helicase Cas3
MQKALRMSSTFTNGRGFPQRILAKSSGETLLAHTAWCLKAARALLSRLPLHESEADEALWREVIDAVALHDIGKAAVGFQRFLAGEIPNWGGCRHELLSGSVASALPDVAEASLLAILTHHKTIPSDGVGETRGTLFWEQIPVGEEKTTVWHRMAAEWRANEAVLLPDLVRILRLAGRDAWIESFPVKELPALALREAWLVRGLGSDSQLKSLPNKVRQRAALVRGLTIASDHLGSARRVPPPIPELRRFQVLPSEHRPFQDACADQDGSCMLRAPTGSGKTEAALLWSQRNQRRNGRLFYVLPQRATINAMYRRLGDGTNGRSGVFGAQHVGLLHAKAASALFRMLESDTDECSFLQRQETARSLADLAHEMWFPIRVCTPHQILRHSLRGRGWEAMLAEFHNGCFIFDELHAYDPRVVGLTLATARLVQRWGARCLFMSATLPNFLVALVRQSLGEVPLIVPDGAKPGDSEILNRKRHRIEFVNGSLMSMLDDIISSAAERGSTLVVCNHVRSAQDMAEALRARLGGGGERKVQLLHGRFNQRDRNRLEERATDRSDRPLILVATQVVEVSLDIDFECAYLEPAPVDALIQRLGRVNRVGERPPALVRISEGQISSHRLYDAKLVQRSLDCLRSLDRTLSESDLIEAANDVYAGGFFGDGSQVFAEGFAHSDIVNFDDRLVAGMHTDWVQSVIEKLDDVAEVLPRGLGAGAPDASRPGALVGGQCAPRACQSWFAQRLGG